MPRYYEDIYILFKTELRISEFVGLTTQDIDLENERLMRIVSYSGHGRWST